MSKYMTEVKQKSKAELEKTVLEMRSEIHRLMVTRKVSQSKDTNTISKKKKQLAVLLTALNQQK
jgi:ribosomal protein L29